uniref:phosphatidate phosphatase n=1 Tax=Gouania willdenowi TaxID=441366 RepID=A0A8C5GP25_GOUWI
MNIVGHLAETVFVTVKELYRGLNPATLTGGIDVVVVRQPDGSFQCSPFHVRFGKLGVLRSKEKIVDIEINGESVDLHMKLGDNGEAFFVEYDESWEVRLSLLSQMMSWGPHRPENLIHIQMESSPPQKSEKSFSFFSFVKRTYKMLFEDFFFLHHFQFLFCPFLRKHIFFSHPHSPKSDSELEVKSHDSSGPQMQWHWGDFPMVSYLPYIHSDKFRMTFIAMTENLHAKQILYLCFTGKRNHHLGPTDIYLDDLTSLDPEVASLYFPKSQSPQSVGSGAMDSGTEYLSDSASYNMDISMSLCGKEGDTSQITKEKFLEHLVTFQDFVNNVGIIEDPSLVICINSNYYNWAVAAPMVLSMTTFQKNLPQSTVERLVKDKMPKKSGRWWFSWRRRHMDNSQLYNYILMFLDDLDSDEAAGLSQKAVITSSLSIESATQSINQMYRKSLRLTSNQIEHLRLREGANKVVFSVTTQYQGTCRAEAAIYLWNWNDRVIISDIDGTITKSDALGHILPQFGKDWTHKGIAKLYHKIHQNGYKFLYCSARAIGMAAITKNYLHWVNDRGTVLPKGPVLLAPSSFFSALHREVIEKKPEVFKVACLGDIRDLFKPLRQPFYGAFGNRINDAFAYKQVGVPETKIFTVNPKGELIQEKTKGNKSSYSHLSEVVEHFFPELNAGGSTSSVLHLSEFSSFSYWKEPLPQLDLDALL